jgi:tripartite-type tricarboxylate transporter receptor subunit TctC
LFTGALGAGSARADWPDRVIHLIVPFGAGSSSDTIARIIAAKMSDQLGQQIVVENRVGGSTIIGTDAIAKSAPDGYTIGLANTTTHAVTAALTPKLPFDPAKDFAPIAMIGSSPFVLIGSGLKPSKTLQEFIALAKAQPGKLSYASAGTATLSHLAGELMKYKAGIDVTHVPYRGSEQSMVDVIAGRIDMMVGSIAPTLQQIHAGKLRGFAVMAESRSPLLPDVPTMTETGISDCDAALWTALVAPAKVPPAIIERLNKAASAVVKSAEVQQALNVQGITPESGSPEDVAARIRADIVKWKKIALDAKIPGAR